MWEESDQMLREGQDEMNVQGAGRDRSPLASWSAAAGLAGIFCLAMPFAGLLAGVAGILLGALALYYGEPRRRRAVFGITAGCCLTLLGAVLVFSMAALRPYEADLSGLLVDMMGQMR